MKVLIAGGTGQIGHLLYRSFLARDCDVVVLGRGSCPETMSGARLVRWDGKNSGPWCDEVDGSDVIINLAGRSVDCRYTKANKRQIFDSRVDSTAAIATAIAASNSPPRLWLQASTATIYSHRFDESNDDVSGVIGGHEPDAPPSWRFSIDVATAWERAVMARQLPQTRRVLMRSAITLSPDPGGIFDVLLRLVRFGLGGSCAGGQQFVSWIHDADFVSAVHWLIEHETIDGPINLCSPYPLRQADFMRVLRDAWGQSIGLPATRWMLGLGAVALRTETELILKSRRVVPKRLVDSGFKFQYPDWADAAHDLCRRWRNQSQRRSA